MERRRARNETSEPPRRRRRLNSGSESVPRMTLRSRNRENGNSRRDRIRNQTEQLVEFIDEESEDGSVHTLSTPEADDSDTSTVWVDDSPDYVDVGLDDYDDLMNVSGYSDSFIINSDLESNGSFEPYNENDLSDVPVNRNGSSNEESSSTETETDSESLFGTAQTGNENTETSQIWERRRLQRRNAISIDNIDNDSIPLNQVSLNSINNSETSTASNSINSNSTQNQPSSDVSQHSERLEPHSSTTTTANFPVEKESKSDRNESITEDEACIICCEPFTNSGEHRLCCLKCGHTYGKLCIEKWIKNENRCPQCNAKASKKDVRILYTKTLRALDTAERDRLLVQLEDEKEKKRKLELECTRYRQMAAEADKKLTTACEELRLLKDRIGNVYGSSSVDSVSVIASTSSKVANAQPAKSFKFVQTIQSRDADCRVGAYDEWMCMFVVSQTVKSPLYPQGSYGVKKVNMVDLRATSVTPLHQKEIRDMEFSKSQAGLLLSVGLDKTAILTNCSSNVKVQSFSTDFPLWSCAWSQTQQNMFYVGTSNGQILLFDIRRPSEVIKTLVVPSNDKTPTARIRFIPPSFDKKSSNVSGLLIQKLNSCWFCELKNDEYTFHQLPVQGNFLTMDFEPKSRHILISSRPTLKEEINPSRHFVGDLTNYYSEIQQSKLYTSDIIQTYTGNEKQIGKLTRPTIFRPDSDRVFVAAETGGFRPTASIWDISAGTTDPYQTISGNDPILDFVPCNVNNYCLLGMISTHNLNIYKMQ